jgi:hypothetical protein
MLCKDSPSKLPLQGEISYDLVMADDMSFVEGSYRVGNGNWQVFIFRKDAIEIPEIISGHWPSGVTGIFVRVPISIRLNKKAIELLMTERLGVAQWCEVQGPDSMQLR